ncbi:hypothetical protein F5884DRAFT_715855, partial [Xylogone sp. PMI_703]
MKSLLGPASFLFHLLRSIPIVRAHSWVEQLSVIAPNGTFIGPPGYPRGNVLRSDPGFSDVQMTYLLPPDGREIGKVILPTDLMCGPYQVLGNQTAGSPALIASPGDWIALRYQENGHVTEPYNQPGKPENGGTVFVYGTSKPRDNDSFLGIHGVWNVNGTGGDRRGKLLATRNFDDGQCYQINPSSISRERQVKFPHAPDDLMGANLWCQTDVRIPPVVEASDTYTLYWIWDWPTVTVDLSQDKSKIINQPETYVTCIDIRLVSDTAPLQKQVHFVPRQDLNHAAISAQLLNSFLVPPKFAAPNASRQGLLST